jgi:hypothetical protein
VFCRNVVEKATCSRAYFYSTGSGYWLLNGEVSESVQAGVVECEVSAVLFESLKELIRSVFGAELKLSTFRLA